MKTSTIKTKNDLLNKESKAAASEIKAEKQAVACPTDYVWRGMTMIKKAIRQLGQKMQKMERSRQEIKEKKK